MLMIIDNEPVEQVNSANYSIAINDVPQLTLRVARKNNPNADRQFVVEQVAKIDGHEWRLLEPTVATNFITVKATHTFLDLADISFLDVYDGNTNVQTILTALLANTEFTVDYDGTGLPLGITLDNFGQDSVYNLFKELVTKMLGAEFLLLPGNVVKVAKFIQSDNEQQIRYAHNVRDIKMTTNSTDIVTHVNVFYGDGHNQLQTFISDTASNYKKAYERIAKDESVKTENAARELARTMFADMEIAYEVDLVSRAIKLDPGELVYTIFEPLNDLFIRTRTMSVTREWDGEEFILTSATVGNATLKERTDIIIKTMHRTSEKISAEFRSKIEQTDRRITAEVEQIDVSIGQIVIEADRISQSITDLNDDLSSRITQTATSIRSEVSALQTSVNGSINTLNQSISNIQQTANSLTSTVNAQNTTISGLDTRMSTAESNINQTAYAITSKVSYEDYNGNYITSLINQTAADVSISASKINLNGAVMVNGSISGGHITGTTITGGSITSNTNIRVNTDLYVGHNIQLTSSLSNPIGYNTISFGPESYDHYIRNSLFGGLEIGTPNGGGYLSIDLDTEFNKRVDFRNATTMHGVVGSDTDDLFLALNPSRTRLYLRIGRGSNNDIGYIPLTT